MTKSSSTSRFAVIVTGLMLVATAVVTGATAASAQVAMTAALDRNMTIGSTGADVMTMQRMLISFGYPIPAGATGYFGLQTQTALAAYQSAQGIVPAAGYFGPITRAKFAATTPSPSPMPMPTPAPAPSDNNNDNDDYRDRDESDRNRADKAIDDAKDAIDDARDEMEEADDNDDDLNDAEDFLDDAEEALDDAEDAFDDRDYDKAKDRADKAEDLADRAVDEIESRSSDDDDDDSDSDNGVTTSARTRSVDGANNDYGEFEVSFDLRAFGEDAFVDEDASVSFEYRIEDGDGNTISGATTNVASISSKADEDDGYYRIDEGTKERFTLKVAFDPLVSDQGKYFRLQLLSVNFSDSPSSPDSEWVARPESRFETNSIFIGS